MSFGLVPAAFSRVVVQSDALAPIRLARGRVTVAPRRAPCVWRSGWLLLPDRLGADELGWSGHDLVRTAVGVIRPIGTFHAGAPGSRGYRDHARASFVSSKRGGQHGFCPFPFRARPPCQEASRVFVGALLLIGFGAKLGLLPFYEWFPGAYGAGSGGLGSDHVRGGP